MQPEPILSRRILFNLLQSSTMTSTTPRKNAHAFLLAVTKVSCLRLLCCSLLALEIIILFGVFYISFFSFSLFGLFLLLFIFVRYVIM